MYIYRLGRMDAFDDLVYPSHYYAAVVIAESKTEARRTHPMGSLYMTRWWEGDDLRGWTHPTNVIVTKIGRATGRVYPGVVVASYIEGHDGSDGSD